MGASNQPDSSAEQPKESWNINGNKNGTAEPERRIKILAAMPNRNVLVLKRDKGKMAKRREAIAMEAQTLPDAVNHKGFGDIILDKGHSVNYEIGFQYFNSSR